RSDRPRPRGDRGHRRTREWLLLLSPLGGEIESVALCDSLDVALVEELDLDPRIALAQLAQLAVLPRHERQLHHRYLDVELMLGQVEVGRERLDHSSALVLLEHERARLVGPGDPVVVEDLGAFELGLICELRRAIPGIRLEIRDFRRHPREDSNRSGRRISGGTVRSTRAMRSIRLTLTPQKREFFDLFTRAAQNAVEISRLLVQMLERFPDESAELVLQIKDREHEGDRLTHEVVDLLNRTFVTPFDRDDMYRLAAALDDVCDHVDEAADDIGLYGVKQIPDEARRQAEVILRSATKLGEAVERLEGFKDSGQQLMDLRELEDEGGRIV